MAVETNTPNATPTVTTGYEEPASRVSLGADGFQQDDTGELSTSVDPTAHEDEALEAELEAAESADAEPSEGGSADEQEASEEEEEVQQDSDLPEYSADDPEVLSKYDAKYTTTDESGKPVLNLDAFNAELEANVAAGKLDINPGSRQYIKDTLGVTDGVIDKYLQGLKAEADAKDNAIYEAAGGQSAWESMVDWGKANYSPEQQKRFNAAISKGGDEAAEQIELLKARAGKVVTPAVTEEPKPLSRLGRRPSSPKKSAGGSSVSTSSIEGYANSEDHRLALVAAEASKDPKQIEQVRARLRASKWFAQS